MNCEDVMDVLDNQKMDRLDGGQRRHIDAHLAVCADCARAWNLQAGLASLPDIALTDDFAARCRAMVAAGGHSGSGSRRVRRVWAAGAFAAVVAAAAMVAVVVAPRFTVPDRPAGVAQPQAAARDETVASAASTRLAPMASVVATQPQFTVRFVPYVSSTDAQFDTAGTASEWREVARAAVHAIADDPARLQALRSLNVSLLEELRKVPDLTLVETDPSDVTAMRRHYVLVVAVVVNSDFRSTDGRKILADNRQVAVGVNVRQERPDRGSIDRMGPMSIIDLQAVCPGGAPPAEAACSDARRVAEAMVQNLRREVFPPDPATTRLLQATFQDASQDLPQRIQALDKLLKLQIATGDPALLREPGVVQAAIAMAAAADPVLRARIWRTLRGAGDAELLQPLLASLAQDADDARLAALETLSADFGSDPRVRAAIEAVSLGDRRALVRAVAQRSLSDAPAWRGYVVASLKDRNRSATQRVEALMYDLYPPGPTRGTEPVNPDYSRILQETLDEEALGALAETLPIADSLQAGDEAHLLHTVGSRFSKSPAVTSMLLEFLERGSAPVLRQVAGETLVRAHIEKPGVRDALVKALNGDPDPSVRDGIRAVMAQQPR